MVTQIRVNGVRSSLAWNSDRSALLGDCPHCHLIGEYFTGAIGRLLLAAARQQAPRYGTQLSCPSCQKLFLWKGHIQE